MGERKRDENGLGSAYSASPSLLLSHYRYCSISYLVVFKCITVVSSGWRVLIIHVVLLWGEEKRGGWPTVKQDRHGIGTRSVISQFDDAAWLSMNPRAATLNSAISPESTTSRFPISNVSSEGSHSKRLYLRQQTNGVRRESCHGTPPKCLILGI